VHFVSIILFLQLTPVIIIVGFITVVLFITRIILDVIQARARVCELCAESVLRVWEFTTESTVMCKVRASEVWDIVFCEQLWRAVGYVVVVTTGLLLGGSVVGAFVLHYCQTGPDELLLHVSCKPLLLVTVLSAIGNPCVRSLWS